MFCIVGVVFLFLCTANKNVMVTCAETALYCFLIRRLQPSNNQWLSYTS